MLDRFVYRDPATVFNNTSAADTSAGREELVYLQPPIANLAHAKTTGVKTRSLVLLPNDLCERRDPKRSR
jgi:hypothetical protein